MNQKMTKLTELQITRDWCNAEEETDHYDGMNIQDKFDPYVRWFWNILANQEAESF
jgi:hypothetical protein